MHSLAQLEHRFENLAKQIRPLPECVEQIFLIEAKRHATSDDMLRLSPGDVPSP